MDRRQRTVSHLACLADQSRFAEARDFVADPTGLCAIFDPRNCGDDIGNAASAAFPGTVRREGRRFGNRGWSRMDRGSHRGNRRRCGCDGPASVISYTWDDNGNLTDRGSDSFAWDYEDRMVSATVNSVTTTLAYRGDGLRDSRTVGGNTTTFTWDIASGLPVVLDDGNQYVYGAGLALPSQSSSR